MAEFRNIHTRIWKDSWFSELPEDAKLLFIYLFSNERASVCGMYELPLKYLVFETGIDRDRVSEIFSQFEAEKKAYYRNGVVWVVNLRKYNDSGNSIKVGIRITKDLEAVPDCELKRMYYAHENIPYPEPLDTLSGNETRYGDETDTDTETDTFPREPELEIYREVTGLRPDYSHEEEVKRNIGEIRRKMHNPPKDILLSALTEKFDLWKAQVTDAGKPYNPSNPKWLEWCITGYAPAMNGKTTKKRGKGVPSDY